MKELLKKLELKRELYRIEAREKFPVFLNYCNPAYSRQWFHTFIAQKCQDLFEGKINKLMVFIPPQHGKSEIVSRMFPAWALGKNPDLKIAGCSYSSDLAGQFSRSIQRNIDSVEYKSLFPDTYLNNANIRTSQRGYLRNVDVFETVGHSGFYKAVGVCTGLTGTPVDIAIIDDPVKDSIEAFSATYRERVWDWYTNVLLTRLHNNSKQLFIMTRWHDDDLAGRIIKYEGSEWEMVSIPAIREDNDNPNDPRAIGEALWESRHCIEKLRKMESVSPRTFSSLYQQNPTIDGGNIIKKEWLGTISLQDFNFLYNQSDRPAIHFFCDTAYTDKNANDPTGIIATVKLDNKIYITSAVKVRKEFPELCRFMPEWVKANKYDSRSTLRIEPKANGLSIIQQLQAATNLNVTKTEPPTESKETRLYANSGVIECGRIVLVADVWNTEFIDEVCGFPAKKHDEFVDLLNYAIDYWSNDYQEIDIQQILNDFR